MNAGSFSKCPQCGRLELPPGLMVVSCSLDAPQLFCSGNGMCASSMCASCGHLVKIAYHSIQECIALQAMRNPNQQPPLKYEEVLEEAERILKS